MEERCLDTVDSRLNAKGNVFAMGDSSLVEIEGKPTLDRRRPARALVRALVTRSKAYL